jgi:hypothetical protein
MISRNARSQSSGTLGHDAETAGHDAPKYAPPALVRYQRGRGYSENTPKHFDVDPPIKPAEPPQI